MNKSIAPKVRRLCLLAGTALGAGTLWANNAVTPKGVVVEPPTLHCIGLEYNIDGDANENAVCAVRYRKKGDSPWRNAQPLLRVENKKHTGPTPRLSYGVPFGNMLAGSLFFLEPDTRYEIELTLTDPDGGAATQMVEAKTRPVPQAAKDGRKVEVGPAELAKTLAAAKAGDIILLKPGEYVGFTVPNNGAPGRPIVVRGADAAKVTVNGKVDLSGREHVHLEKVTVAGTVQIGQSNGVVVQGCTVTSGKIGIHGPNARNCYVADNTLIGRNDWEKEGRNTEGGVGVKVSGSGAIICYNRFREHWDNISLFTSAAQNKDDGSGFASNCSIDIYGNDLLTGSDDAIEADYLNHNIRIFRNRITNAGSAISFQPIYGGPGYVLYNEIYNSRIKPYKFHVSPSGMIVYHNTSVSSWNGWSGGDPSNLVVKNNIIFCNPLYKGEAGGNVSTDGAKVVADYNGYNQVRNGISVSYGKAISGKSLPELARHGVEQHGVLLDLGIFQHAQFPSPGRSYKDPYGKPYEFGQFDLRLKSGAAAIDAGVALPNINDGYAGRAPDLGCYEFGQPAPHYGPRPEALSRLAGN